MNCAVPVWPAASVAEQTTFVTPSGNVDPEGGLHVACSGELLGGSTAVACPYVTAAPLGPVASATTFDGGVTMGALGVLDRD